MLLLTVNSKPDTQNHEIRVRLFRVDFHYIVIGSDTDGQYEDVPSSYIFARNS